MTADSQEHLQHRMEQILMEKRHKMEMYASMLEGNSPLKKLSKGYAFMTDSAGKTLRSVEEVQMGASVKAHMTDGTVVAQVKEIVRLEKQ